MADNTRDPPNADDATLLLSLADRERAPAPFESPGDTLKSMAVLSLWVATVQKRWAGWDEARDEALRTKRVTAR